ncbi:polysaccharide biosynthesis tyrosine autokinase [Arthrobacter sp. Cr_A7]|uniref:polysaccharide biosynthesis tyrosine autokinase n=1 Tax=Arthrobacter sp. Cr_A7 TaxID=3031017 RepID=UPI0023DC4D5B|nr:polysaccharide biosynthesis tyrosine autokinase [Arthrobacter sp. Cr_A7]MDF2048837.1 polysaccharide biosynthesis tyrosine autokinase [Arthrobacter sp. Cr_A7]
MRPQGGPSLDLRDYLRVLRRSWMLIAAVTLAGLLAGGAASITTKPTYTSQTQLFVATHGSGSINELQAGNSFGQARVQSYVKTVTTPTVLQPVIDSLGLTETPGELAEKVKATTDLNTVIITVTVSDQSPARAAAIAQGVATSLVEAVEVLEKPTTGESSPIRISIVTPASAPSSPSAPNVQLYLLLGVGGGLALGAVAAIMASSLDNRVRGEEDVRRVTSASILGGIPYDQDAESRPLVTAANDHSLRAESFRQLRTNLQFAHVDHQNKTLLITSSLPGEGKTTTAINLAITIAESGRSVVLIDADLRRPMVGEYLGLDRNAGLTTALVGEADVDDLLQPWGTQDLYVLTSGQIPPNPSELLGSVAMKDLVTRLAATFDTVIVDAPPLLPVTDASVLAQIVDGAAVVVGSGRIRQTNLTKSFESLELVEANILGVVLNRLPTKGPEASSYGYYSYESHSDDSQASASKNTNRRARRAGPEQEPIDKEFEGLSNNSARDVETARSPSRYPF